MSQSFKMLDISFHVKIMILLSSFPLYIFFLLFFLISVFSFCSLNISLMILPKGYWVSGLDMQTEKEAFRYWCSRNEIQNPTQETKLIFWKISYTDMYSQRTVREQGSEAGQAFLLSVYCTCLEGYQFLGVVHNSVFLTLDNTSLF